MANHEQIDTKKRDEDLGRALGGALGAQVSRGSEHAVTLETDMKRFPGPVIAGPTEASTYARLGGKAREVASDQGHFMRQHVPAKVMKAIEGGVEAERAVQQAARSARDGGAALDPAYELHAIEGRMESAIGLPRDGMDEATARTSTLADSVDLQAIRDPQALPPADVAAVDEQIRADAQRERAKEERKAAESARMKLDREEQARGWSLAQAAARARSDVAEHARAASPNEAFYQRANMAERAKANPSYSATLSKVDPALFARVQNNESEKMSVQVSGGSVRDEEQERPAGQGRSSGALENERAEREVAPPAVATKAPVAAAAGPSTSALEGPTRGGDEGVERPASVDRIGRADLASGPVRHEPRFEDAPAPTPASVAGEAEAEGVRKRKEHEAILAVQGSLDVNQTGRELKRDDIILPRRIIQTYTEVDGKYFAKDTNRVMFEDKGEKLATSTTNKEAVADMVALAKAKQWESLKLTGSQEFRREAWLQAESQGIKTQGYTPKDNDLAALKLLTQERSTNSITPLQERKLDRPALQAETSPAAPRHDLNKNQAAMHAEATKNVATNIQELQKRPTMAERSVEDLTKLAYWRGLVKEETKRDPRRQEQALDRFDAQADDPQFLKRLNQETQGSIDDKTVDRTRPSEQKRDTFEQSL